MQSAHRHDCCTLPLDESTDSGAANVVVKRELLYRVSDLPRDITFHHDVAKGGVSSGVSDLIALDEERLLVLERSYVRYKEGSNRDNLSVARIFLVNHGMDRQHEITDKAYLTEDDMRDKELVSKELIFNSLDYKDQEIFKTLNIEGLTFGPLVNGNRTLVLVNDNNASTTEPTRLLFFTLANPE